MSENFVEIIVLIEHFFNRAISVLRQKGALKFKKSNGTGSGLSKLVLLDSGIFLHVDVFFLPFLFV